MIEINKVYQKDCLEGLSQLENKSIDLSFIDPPYNLGKDYGVSKDDMQEEEFRRFMIKVISELKRVSKKGIGIYTYGKKMKYFWDIFPESEPIIIFTKAVGWESPTTKLRQHFHTILTNAIAIKQCKNLWDDIRVKGEGYFFDEKVYEHPCQTTLKGTRRFIDLFSEKGDIILDCFMGTGTTAEVSKQLDRKFIGFEINPEYIKIINKRLGFTTVGDFLSPKGESLIAINQN